jgi:hypothetical protein
MRSLQRYVANHGITVEILSGPDFTTDEDGWWNHTYALKLLNADLGTEMTLPWKTGLGITEDPDERPEKILDCLIGDAWGYENARGFEDWAGEYGYDPDSRKAESTWKAVGELAQALAQFLGGYAELERLASNYERL